MKENMIRFSGLGANAGKRREDVPDGGRKEMDMTAESKAQQESKARVQAWEAQTKEAALWAIRRVKALGGDEASAEASVDQGLSVAVREGDLESVEHTEESQLTVSAWIGKRKGVASTSDLSEEALEAAAAAAVRIARYAAEDPCTGLPDPASLQTRFPDLSLHHPFLGGVEEAKDYLVRAEAAALAFDSSVVNTDGVRFDTSEGCFTLANTLGFCAGYPYGRHSVDCWPVVERAEESQRDGWWAESRFPEALPTPEELGRKAASRAVARLGSRSLPTMTCPVIFEANVATGFLDMLEELASGRALYRKASCLVGRFGTQIFPSHVSIEEDPYLVGGIGSAAFDNEGCAGSRRLVVDKGILRGAFLSSYSARKLGLTTTGNAGGAYGLRLTSSKTTPVDSLEAMLQSIPRGVLVTELIGAGLNAVTGDYSQGAAGFWVEGGRIVHPVDGITLSGNMLSILNGLAAVGADEADNSGKRSGSVLIEAMDVAGSL